MREEKKEIKRNKNLSLFVCYPDHLSLVTVWMVILIMYEKQDINVQYNVTPDR